MGQPKLQYIHTSALLFEKRLMWRSFLTSAMLREWIVHPVTEIFDTVRLFENHFPNYKSDSGVNDDVLRALDAAWTLKTVFNVC